MCRDKKVHFISRKSKITFWKSRQSWVSVASFTLFFLSVAVASMAGEVWVANMKGANVQIIDTNSNKVVKTISTGAGAHNVTFSPDGKLAYIANLGTNSITIIDSMSKEILADIVTDTKAHDVAISPDGKLAVVCNVGAGNITFMKNWRLYLTASNLGNAKAITSWRPYGARPVAPRQVMAGIKWKPK